MEHIPSPVGVDSPVDSIDIEEASCSSGALSPTDLKLLLSVNASPAATKKSHFAINIASASENIEDVKKWDEIFVIDLSETDTVKSSSYLLDDTSSDSEKNGYELSDEEQNTSEETKASLISPVADEPDLNRLNAECTPSDYNTEDPKSDLEVCLESAKQSLLETFFKVDGVLKVQSHRLLAEPQDTFPNLPLVCAFENFDEFNLQAAAQLHPRRFIDACKSGSKITIVEELFQNSEPFTAVRIEVLRKWFVSRQIAFKLHICTTGRSTLYFALSDIEVCCCGYGTNKTLVYPENKSDLRDLPFGLVEYFKDLFEFRLIPRKVNFNSASVLITPYKWKDSNCSLKFLRIVSGIIEHSAEKENIVDDAPAWNYDPCFYGNSSEQTSFLVDTVFGLPARNQDFTPEEIEIGHADIVDSERLNLLHSYLLSEYSTFADLLLRKFYKRECLNLDQSEMEWVVIDTKFNAEAQLFDSDVPINRLVSGETRTEILFIQFLDLKISCFSICLTQIPDYLFIGPMKQKTAVALSETFRYCFILSSFDLSRNSESTSFFHSYAVNVDHCLAVAGNRETIPRLTNERRLKCIGSLMNAAKLICQFFLHSFDRKVYVYFEQRVLYVTTSLQEALKRYLSEFSNWKLIATLLDSSLNVFMIVHTSEGYRVVNDRLLSKACDSVRSCLVYLVRKQLLVSLTHTYELVAYARNGNELCQRCSFYYCSVQSQWYGNLWFLDQPFERLIVPINEAIGVFAYRLKDLCPSWSTDFRKRADFNTFACTIHGTCLHLSIDQNLEAQRLLTGQINMRDVTSSLTEAEAPQQCSRKEKIAATTRNYRVNIRNLFRRLSFLIDIDPSLGKLLAKRSILDQATWEIKKLKQANGELRRIKSFLSEELEKQMLRLHELQTTSE